MFRKNPLIRECTRCTRCFTDKCSNDAAFCPRSEPPGAVDAGVIVAVVFGGMVLGAFIATAIIFIILKKRMPTENGKN